MTDLCAKEQEKQLKKVKNKRNVYIQANIRIIELVKHFKIFRLTKELEMKFVYVYAYFVQFMMLLNL